MFKKILVIVPLFMFLSTASAGEYLTADEIKALFTNKTFDIHNVVKDKNLQGHANGDGEHFVYIPWKEKISERKWWIDEGQHCTSHPKRGDNCKKMKDMGNGVYQGYSDGEHTHTLSNFRDGNQLPDS